ncbi:MAG: hypothetical protein FWD79_06630 [Desulfobulbus sp.]|nr:hypothetical protein [Desulfobulbus sp.]
MNTDFKEVMSKCTDDELIRIVTVERDDYQHLAIISAEHEIKKRNIPTKYIKQIENKTNTIKKQIKVKQHIVTCATC